MSEYSAKTSCYRSRSVLAAFACAASLASAPCCVNAAEFTVTPGDGITYVQVTGQIVPGDDDKFRRVVGGSILFAIIVLDSPGGSVGPALTIGREIRARGLSTLVKAGAVCASACALVWLAGDDRYMAHGAKVGFHAAFAVQGDNLVERGMPNALIGAYLNELKLPTDAIAYVTSKGPREVAWLDALTGMHVGINFKVAGERGD